MFPTHLYPIKSVVRRERRNSPGPKLPRDAAAWSPYSTVLKLTLEKRQLPGRSLEVMEMFTQNRIWKLIPLYNFAVM